MPPRILAYSATAEFRHDSIEASIEALKAKESALDVKFDFTEDKSKFTDENLSQYDAILFLNNSGIVLDDTGKAALQNYFNLGGNFLAIHCAAAALRDSPFFGRQIGAYFDYHPEIQESAVDVLDKTHPSTVMLPDKWHLLDEMYNFESDPRAVGAKILLTADESSYQDPEAKEKTLRHGSPHPIGENGVPGVDSHGIAGRSWFTGLGHCIEIWSDDLFLGHVMGGIKWVLQSKTTKAFNANGNVGNAS
ncbi:ThuA-like domain-containing protein [Suillus lakei]|nr:ThuA-like domain-containing protein [Suillus lakei]